MPFELILIMSAAVAGYVLITALLWAVFRKRGKSRRKWNVLIGLIYGACAVIANHLSIEGSFEFYNLNVRDIAPLAAGFFFSPLSGIIAGTIGGAERLLAGQLWHLGWFTQYACSMSTFLAGIFAALLNRVVFKGKRPPALQALIFGMVTEVFHMYAVLFTNRDELKLAYSVVQTAAVPMILFTGIGVMLCSLVIRKQMGEPLVLGWKRDQEKTPVTVLFQRGLMAVTVLLFLINFVVGISLQKMLLIQDAQFDLETLAYGKLYYYEKDENLDRLRDILLSSNDHFILYGIVDVSANRAEMFIGADDTYEIEVDPEDVDRLMDIANQPPESIRLPSVFGSDSMNYITKSITLKNNRLLVICRSMESVNVLQGWQTCESALSDILLFTALYMLVATLAERLVVRNLYRVNASLRKITGGNLNETVWVHTSAEFTELSDDINKTVTALRGYIDDAEKRMEADLKLAAQIQDSALPKDFNLPSGRVEIHALMTPAKTVGGDFYDFFYAGQDHLCLVIADVSGKGVPASLFMMKAKTAIKNYSIGCSDPVEILRKLNHALCEQNEAKMFVSVWLGVLDLSTGLMRCANAGHEWPVLMRAGGDYELLKDPHSLVLAVMDPIPMKEYEIRLYPGDRLFVYTDGIPEAVSEKDEPYGCGRLVQRLNRMKNADEARTLESVLRDIRNFAGKAEQFDDITMMGITFRGGPAPEA